MSYALRIKESKNHDKCLKFLTDRFQKENLRVTQEEETNATVLRIDITDNTVLEQQAEKQGLYKPIRTDKSIRRSVRELNQFVRSKSSSYLNYRAADDSFWYPCEKLDLLRGILRNMKVGDDLDFIKELSNDFIMIDDNDYLFHVFESLGIVSDSTPLHDSKKHRLLFKQAIFSSPLSHTTLDKMYRYYGSKVALYFAWMNHFTIWLTFPGVFGGFIWLHNYLDDEVSIDNSRLAPYYTMFIVCWAVLFVQYWKRRCSVLSCEWGTMGVVSDDRVRCDFEGEVRISPITGSEEIYYPHYKRVMKYAQSIIITSGMLFIAFGVMVLSLNFQGYIHSNSYGASWLHFPRIQQFSEPGRIFDPNGSGYWTLIPTIVHAITINILNTKYRTIAVALTKSENHKTEDDFENALIIKRFLFEAFDSYIALFFLAFVQCDIVLLRGELVALYTADSARRVITECLIPFLMQMKSRWDRKEHGKKNDESYSSTSSLVDELEKDEYEQFDDYLEMVIQFGYVTLFASAFPLSGLLSILCNIIEIKSDLFKLTYILRRPNAIRTCNIGTWLPILQGLVWMSIMTNVFIFAFTTEQMMQIFPTMFTIVEDVGGSDHVHLLVEGKGRWVVGIAVIIEHGLFLLASLVYAAIPDIPASVSQEMKRREYEYALLMAERKGQR